MGYKKGKKEKKVTLCFYNLNQQYRDWNSLQFPIELQQSILTYDNLLNPYLQFKEKYSIYYQTCMFYTHGQYQKQLINHQFTIPYHTIKQQYDGNLIIIVQSLSKIYKQQIQSKLDLIKDQIQQLSLKLSDLPQKDQIQMFRRNSMPTMSKTISTFNRTAVQTDLDIAILFSQPIFQQKKNKPAKQPVDFRSQIQRLQAALKSAPQQQIKLKCQRATLQNLRYLIRHLKPKILHIISHGASDGSLEFQDDSTINLGYLRIAKVQQIQESLVQLRSQLPQVVFVNTCYSQNVGRAFHHLGVKYVVTINSADSIEDQAAQIFSQHFYRNIFKGEPVSAAFASAKKQVEMKHNSHGCCCNHKPEQHFQNCLWLKVKAQLGRQNAHRLYHIPSSQCKCQLKNYNRHKITCQWALQALTNININFQFFTDEQNKQKRKPKKSQILEYTFEKNQLMVCCCITPHKKPHSESHKFKFLTNQDHPKSVYNIIPGSYYPQIIDDTAHQLLQFNQHMPKDFYGRQEQLFKFLKQIRAFSHQNIYIVYGITGVGRSAFTIKAATYSVQRRVYQIFFYIDLYDIKEKNTFRFTFNQATKLNFDGKTITPNIRDKKIVLVLDNCDDFLQKSQMQFYDEMNSLKCQLPKSKIIIVMKRQSFASFESQKLHSENFQLPPMNTTAAAQMFFFKMKHQLQMTVDYNRVFRLVQQKQQAKTPKVIESICHSFGDRKFGSVSFDELAQKINLIGSGDNAIYDLININLQNLKFKSLEAYQMLIFISQLSEGLTLDDFVMFSVTDKQESLLQIPIKKNWEKNFALLFEEKQQKIQTQQLINLVLSKEVSSPNPIFDMASSHNSISVSPSKFSELDSQNEQIKVPKGDSYFIEQISGNRFVVKRFIRDFLWKKYINETNLRMKFLCVSFLSILMQNVLQNLTKSKYIHQELINYNYNGIAGIYSFKTNFSSSYQANLTQSARFAHQLQNQIQKILSQNRALQQKIKSKDPSVLLSHHKQDFLNIYDYKWEPVYQYLEKKNNSSHKIFVSCLQNLLFAIPTALMISRVQPSLLLYAIQHSLHLLKDFRDRSLPSRNLKIFIKVSLMKVDCQLKQDKINSAQVSSIFDEIEEVLAKSAHILQNKTEFQQICMSLMYERKYIQLYIDYQDILKQNRQVKICLEKFKKSIDFDWGRCQNILTSKKDILLGFFYSQILKKKQFQMFSFRMMKQKSQHREKLMKGILEAIQQFSNKKLVKLQLKACILQVQLSWELDKIQKSKGIGFTLQQSRHLIQQCEQIYNKPQNKLKGITKFDYQIKSLIKQINQKLWQSSKNSIIFMRAVPIWKIDRDSVPIFQNLVRKKNNFRLQIQNLMKQSVPLKRDTFHQTASPDSIQTPSLKLIHNEKKQRKNSSQNKTTQIDISTKFQILTRKKLQQQLKTGCSMMFIYTNAFVTEKQQIQMVFQGSGMNQQRVKVNNEFIKQFDFSHVRILILSGQNTLALAQRLNQLIFNPPVLIALSVKQLSPISQKDSDEQLIRSFSQRQNRREAAMIYTKEFLRKVKTQKITNQDHLMNIHNYAKSKLIEVTNKIIVQLRYEKSSKLDIQFKPGTYKNLSPGYEGNHNLMLSVKQGGLTVRRWRQLNKVLQILNHKNQKQQPAFINIFGEKSSGKTKLIQQIGKILVERQFYDYGVYLFSGQTISKKYQSDIERYIHRQNEKGKLPSLQYFMSSSYKNLIIMIDDFHLIKPKSNGLYKLFIQKLIKRKVNVIMSTNESKPNQEYFPGIKLLKIQKLKQYESKLLIFNIVNYQEETDELLVKKALESWKDGKKSLADIIDTSKEDLLKDFQIVPSFEMQQIPNISHQHKIYSQFTPSK